MTEVIRVVGPESVHLRDALLRLQKKEASAAILSFDKLEHRRTRHVRTIASQIANKLGLVLQTSVDHEGSLHFCLFGSQYSLPGGKATHSRRLRKITLESERRNQWEHFREIAQAKLTQGEKLSAISWEEYHLKRLERNEIKSLGIPTSTIRNIPSLRARWHEQACKMGIKIKTILLDDYMVVWIKT